MYLIRKWFRNTVTATVSSQEKINFLLKLPDGGLGATHAINYKTQNFAEEAKKITGGKGVDVVIDFVGQSHWQRNIDALAPDGRMTMLGIFREYSYQYSVLCKLCFTGLLSGKRTFTS